MMNSSSPKDQISAGSAIFSKLGALGVDYVFVNSGTDFPPIIEGLIEAQNAAADLPTPVVVPHEHVAMGMAHGYYQITGQAQAVMLHTNVGLANGATGAINAYCDQVPMLLMSGRTPVMEKGRFGARTVPIGWGQEMFDQAAMVRETTKWDYELRFPEQIVDLMDRSWAIANSTPKGPTYLSLPREVLCESVSTEGVHEASTMQPVKVAPDGAAVAQAAALLAQAKHPLIIAQRGAGSKIAYDALTELVSEWAIPVCHYWPNQISIPMAHPMQVGVEPHELLQQADVVLVIDSMAPWWPDKVTLSDDLKVIQLGADPLYTRTPIRNFPADVNLMCETADGILQLVAAMATQSADQQIIAERYQRVAAYGDMVREKSRHIAEQGNGAPMTKAWVAQCIAEAVNELNLPATVYAECGCPPANLNINQHLGYMQVPVSGGLGWGFAAALGGQLADRDRLIIATMGDGSYMFANPTVCHQVAEALDLPVICLVLNNEEWGAVRQSAEGLYRQGLSPQAEEVPLTSLKPSPDFCLTAQASRAYTETVTSGSQLPAALQRAIKVAREEKRQVLINIAIA